MTVKAEIIDAGTRKAGFQFLKVFAGVVALVALVLIARRGGALLPQFAAWVDGLGVWGPVVFILGYAAATVAFLPGSILTLVAGAIFGLTKGAIYAFIAATLGASVAFLVSRYLARTAIEKKIAGNARFAAIDRAVSAQGLKLVFLLRLSPVFPFTLLNYALGLTKIAFKDYLLASFGMIPGTILYVYYGKLAGDVAALAGGAAAVQKDAGYYAVLGLGLGATIVVTTIVTRIARRALKEATGE